MGVRSRDIGATDHPPAEVLVFDGNDGALLESSGGVQSGLNFSQFDTVTPNLNLGIRTTNEIDKPVFALPGEIEHGPFRRTVELGADVVADQARASYEDGILQVEVPLAARQERTRRVPIEEGADPGDGESPGGSG